MPSAALEIDHLAVQTANMDACVRWYKEFFGCTESWTMEEFAPLSHKRLPGLLRVTELATPSLKFHIFTRRHGQHEPSVAEANQFQHVCVRVDSPAQLRRWRDRWFALLPAYRGLFAVAEPASEIDIDARGVHSFYARDINGLEYEFTCLPLTELQD
jgi:catechol 2,3-dioxygenase-like lactoylglutathione lyase family enzyme